MSKEKNIQTLLLDGGCHCFNFVNTVHSRKEENVFDYLKNYDDFIDWSERVELLPKERLKKLKASAKSNIKVADKTLAETKNKRELLYNFFSGIISQKRVEDTFLDEFNNTLSVSLSNLAFKISKGKIDLTWNESEVDLSEPLWVVFKNAFDILTTIPLSRYKECSSCGWLFLDKSKNNSRVWCNMQTCGSLDKAKRYYYRKKNYSL